MEAYQKEHILHHEMNDEGSAAHHDIEVIQRHLTDAHLLAEPHAALHDALRHQEGLIVKEVPSPHHHSHH